LYLKYLNFGDFNFIISLASIESLRRQHRFFGPTFNVEALLISEFRFLIHFLIDFINLRLESALKYLFLLPLNLTLQSAVLQFTVFLVEKIANVGVQMRRLVTRFLTAAGSGGFDSCNADLIDFMR
jgi:hypothetical protein